MTVAPEFGVRSRREVLLAAAVGGVAAALPFSRAVAQTSFPPPLTSPVKAVEHRIPHDGHSIYVRDYPGKGPAYVLMHGFPDNLHIYDYIVPYLTRAGHRVVAFDFLGFGQSEKIAQPNAYSFPQQVGDLAAVVDALKLDKFIPVGHDAGGPVAINYAIDHADRVAWLCLMNCYYAQDPTFRLPEIIEVMGNKSLQDLADAFISTPDKMEWLLSFQDAHFQRKSPPELQARFNGILRPIVRKNFADGAGPAFRTMTSQVYDNVAYNTTRLPDVRKFAPKVALIWGTQDPYLTPEASRAIAGNFPNATVKSVEAGHWLMIDRPEEVARLLLAGA